MIRFLLRLLASIALAIAFVMAVLDATRTVAGSGLVLTPLSVSWAAASPETLQQAQAFVIAKVHPLLWESVAVPVLGLPGFVVFGALALILFGLGYKPARRSLAFEN